MSNMSYCRFRNTLGDLKDCREALDDEGIESLSKEEQQAAKQLIRMCEQIADAGYVEET